MVILVDTNILMDVIANREPYAEYGKRILEKCAKREVTGIMATAAGVNTLCCVASLMLRQFATGLLTAHSWNPETGMERVLKYGIACFQKRCRVMILMDYIHRALEERLQKYEKTYKAILVTGARQVGKSTLLRKVFADRKYVTLDDPFMEQQAKEAGDLFLTLNPPPITIDEVQRAKELFRYIKIKCDESGEKGVFCLSGSQPFHLMQNVSESLSGRIGILELSGLSMRESCGDPFNRHFLPTLEYVAQRRKTGKKPENIWEVIHRGGYPELWNGQKEWSAFYADYVRTYVERDVRDLAAVQDLNAFRQLLIAAAARTGEILNYSAIASEIGKDVGTVKSWISILEASGIVYLLEPYTSGLLKRVIRSPKLYFRDTGLVCYLTRWLTAENLAYGAMSGPVLETFAVSEILKSFSNGN